jgi:hypothetical protein
MEGPGVAKPLASEETRRFIIVPTKARLQPNDIAEVVGKVSICVLKMILILRSSGMRGHVVNGICIIVSGKCLHIHKR